MARFDPIVFSSWEGLHQENYLIATYFLEVGASVDPVELGVEIAVDQTTGTWTAVPAETPEVRRHHMAKLIALHEVPNYEFEVPQDTKTRRYLIQIAFPTINFGPQIPMLLSSVFGNLSSRGWIKLLDLQFPRTFLESFPGPKFGIEGLRRFLGIWDRPILCNVIKPCTGISPEVGAELVYQAARGGVDIIKDDELIGDTPFSPMVKRVKEYMCRLKEADEQKGEKTLFAINVTDRQDKIRDNALRAIEAGANALMISFATVGFSMVRTLAEDKSINVPIMGHMNFAGALCESPCSGVSSELICGKLARMVGMDMVLVYPPQSRFHLIENKFERVLQILQQPFSKIKPSFPLLAGGVHPGIVPATLDSVGTDVIIGAGGSVHGHPGGAVAGARAFRQAFEAYSRGVDLEGWAQDKEELQQALGLWGTA